MQNYFMSEVESDDGARWWDKAQWYMTDCFGRQSFYLSWKVDYKKCWQLAPEHTVHFMWLEFQ